VPRQPKLRSGATDLYIRGVLVHPYPQVYPYPARTRGYGSGRVSISRVHPGYGYMRYGYGYTTGIPAVQAKFDNLR
jgi:hypothetical protein